MSKFNSRVKTKTMSVSTLTSNFTKGKRLLFVKDKWANDDISLMTLPNSFQSISFLSLNEMIRKFDPRSPMPDAIIINLASVSTIKIIPVLRRLKSHDLLKQIPIIGLQCGDIIEQKQKLLQLGFSDCFSKPIEWKTIEKRVTFLNKYKTKLAVTIDASIDDDTYKMPNSKRAFDIFVASTLLLLLSPLFLVFYPLAHHVKYHEASFFQFAQ